MFPSSSPKTLLTVARSPGSHRREGGESTSRFKSSCATAAVVLFLAFAVSLSPALSRSASAIYIFTEPSLSSPTGESITGINGVVLPGFMQGFGVSFYTLDNMPTGGTATDAPLPYNDLSTEQSIVLTALQPIAAPNQQTYYDAPNNTDLAYATGQAIDTVEGVGNPAGGTILPDLFAFYNPNESSADQDNLVEIENDGSGWIAASGESSNNSSPLLYALFTPPTPLEEAAPPPPNHPHCFLLVWD